MSELPQHPGVPPCPMGTSVSPGDACPAAGYGKEEETEHRDTGAAALVKGEQALEQGALPCLLSVCISWLCWCLEEYSQRRTEHEEIFDPLPKNSQGGTGDCPQDSKIVAFLNCVCYKESPDISDAHPA